MTEHVKTRTGERFYLAFVCLAAALMVMPIVWFGIPDTVDLPQHYRFAQIFHDSMLRGDLFPGWASGENFGYGDIGIRFYPPLAYYVLALAKMLVGNWYDAAWLTFIFWMALGSCGVYLWVKNWFPAKESAFAALIYVFIPFHLHQLYVGYNNYSEYAATSLITFCLAFMTRIFRDGKLADVLGLAVFYALLIVSHLPLTLIGSMSLFVYALLLMRKDNFIAPVLKCASAVALALAASAFYWVPMATELGWLNHASDRFSSGFFDYSNNFFPLSYFMPPHVNKKMYVAVDFLFVLNLLFLLSAIVYYVYRKKNSSENNSQAGIFKTVLPLGLFAFFMVTPLSYPIWELLTPLQKVQFPIRWMPIVAMCGAAVAAASIHYLLRGDFLKNRLWSYACLVFCFAIGVFNYVYILHPTSYVPIEREALETKIRELPREESFNCWWTVWSQAKAFDTKEKISIENRQIEIVEWSPEKRVFEVAAGERSAARVATFYYPHWQAIVNGSPAAVEKDADGVIMIPLSGERSIVELKFEEPLKVKIASIVSVAAWLFFSAALLVLLFRRFASAGKNAFAAAEPAAIADLP